MAKEYQCLITPNHTVKVKFFVPLLRKDTFQSFSVFAIPNENDSIPIIAINKYMALYFNPKFYKTTKPQNIEVICSHSSEVASTKEGLIKLEPGCTIQTKMTRIFATNHQSLTQHLSASIPIHYQTIPEWSAQNQPRPIKPHSNPDHWWLLAVALCVVLLLFICLLTRSQSEHNSSRTTDDMPLQQPRPSINSIPIVPSPDASTSSEANHQPLSTDI
jgi:hypothetical protein